MKRRELLAAAIASIFAKPETPAAIPIFTEQWGDIPDGLFDPRLDDQIESGLFDNDPPAVWTVVYRTPPIG